MAKPHAAEITSVDYLEALKSLGYAFRMNDCNNDIEVSGEMLNDPLESEIRTRMRDAGYKSMHAVEDAYIAEARKNLYHPVKEYLWGLRYNGCDTIGAVSQCFNDKYGVFPTWFRKWLIGSVKKVCEDGEQNPMLVLDGAQGIGKSTFARWLCSGISNKIGKNDLFHESPIRPDDKDDLIRLASIWIWEVAELGRTTRHSDQEALKHFLSTRSIKVRKAWGKRDTRKPAMASFLGTVNNESGLLADSTGSRRFLICHIIGKPDWAYIDMDANSLWAQAMEMYKNGETSDLSDVEKARSLAVNEEYEIDNPVLGMIEKYILIDPDNDEWWESSIDILERLTERGLVGQRVHNSMALAVAMNKLGLVKSKRENERGRQVRGYAGVKIPSDLLG